jgi:hypothetical protein
MSDEPAAYRCGLYLRGHDVHWIQAKLSAQQRSERPFRPGHLVGVQSDGLVIVEVDDVLHRLWNHDPQRLKRLVARNRGVVSYQPGLGLLRTASSGGSYLFCVADADNPDVRACPNSPPTGTMIELLRNAGGFSIRGRVALGLDDSNDAS